MSSVKKKIIIILTILLIAIQGAIPVTYSYAAEIIGSGIVTEENINVRQGPGTDYEKVGKVYKDNVVRIVAVEGDWLKIEYQGGEAYVSAEFVDYEITAEEEEVIEEEETVADTEELSFEEELKNETQDEKTADYYILFGTLAAIVILAIFILVTIRSIKKIDDDEYDDDEDDDEYDEYEYEEYDNDEEYEYEDEEEEYEYDPRYVRQNQQVAYQNQQAYANQQAYPNQQAYANQQMYQNQQAYSNQAAYQNIKQYANGQQVYEDDEYEYVVVRKPRNAAQDVPQPVTRRADDYTIDIDPSFFE